jgi:hypothetical protein
LPAPSGGPFTAGHQVHLDFSKVQYQPLTRLQAIAKSTGFPVVSPQTQSVLNQIAHGGTRKNEPPQQASWKTIVKPILKALGLDLLNEYGPPPSAIPPPIRTFLPKSIFHEPPKIGGGPDVP